MLMDVQVSSGQLVNGLLVSAREKINAPLKEVASRMIEIETSMIDRLICSEAAKSDLGLLFTKVG